ncbi:lambda-exonuclease family protein [Frankia sp. AvcI1]|uniref:YqaJ viral recombinase family nuclease n=1 Tax=Frankia sp. AvcI1 TaxID=573496 RepID=UPI002118285F|nr:YqaJ viral recombinase family protein [Frankia sp. AvcI1]
MSVQTTAPARQASPPYRLVLPASADRALWLAERRKGIGSSDVAAVMGVSSYGSAQHVYYDKRGDLELESDAGEAALWGSLLEETVAREWARRNRSVVRRVGLIARKDAIHQRCTLDRRVDECPLNREQHERCALEVKCRNAFVAKKWKKNIPDDVLAQVLWQLYVTGYDHIHVAVLIGGSDFRQYTIRRADHTALIGDIVTVVDRLWRDIQLGRVPALTGEEPVDPMLDLFDELWPDRQGMKNLDEFPALALEAFANITDYETARLEESAARKRKEAAKVAMTEALQDRAGAVLDGDLAYEYVPTEGREKTNTTLLAEKYPEAYAECVVREPGKRLSIAKRYRMTELPS